MVWGWHFHAVAEAPTPQMGQRLLQFAMVPPGPPAGSHLLRAELYDLPSSSAPPPPPRPAKLPFVSFLLSLYAELWASCRERERGRKEGSEEEREGYRLAPWYKWENGLTLACWMNWSSRSSSLHSPPHTSGRDAALSTFRTQGGPSSPGEGAEA